MKKIALIVSMLVMVSSPSQSVLISDGYNKPMNVILMEEYILVSEKGGDVYVADLEGSFYVKRDDPILDLEVLVSGERGLLDIKLRNGVLYVYYTHPSDEFDRLESYTLDIENNLSSYNSHIIDVPSWAWNHHGGTIEFHPDGDMFLTTGDGSSTPDPISGLGGQYRSQMDSSLNGKVLKIDPNTGEFIIWAKGLRNPFRAVWHDNQLWVGDVGWASWEEVVIVEQGSNHGWGFFEGNDSTGVQNVINPDTGELFVLENSTPQVAYGHGNLIEVNGVADTSSFSPLGNAVVGVAGGQDGVYFVDYLYSWVALYDGDGVQSVGDTGVNFMTSLVYGGGDLYFTATNGVYRFEPETLSIEEFNMDMVEPVYYDMLGRKVVKKYASAGAYIAEYRRSNQVMRRIEVIKN